MILNVMIVEDEEWVKKGLIKKIQRLLPEVKIVGEASDGQEAIHILKNMKPEILITDIRLPVMDGIQLIREVKQTHPYMKIIIVSGFAEFDIAQEALLLGVSGYILKPVNDHDLAEVITKVSDELRCMSGEGYTCALPSAILSKISECIRKDDSKVLEDVISELFSGNTIDQGNLVHIEILMKQVAKCIEHTFIDLGYLGEDSLSLPPDIIMEITEVCHDRVTLSKYVFHVFQKIIAQVKDNNQNTKNIIQNITKYIGQHYNDDLSVEYFANKYSINLPYLSKKFKKATGVNLSEFIINKRLKQAMELLENTKLSISEVSESVGFSDISYFFRIFKKRLGVTPSEYRNAKNNGDSKET